MSDLISRQAAIDAFTCKNELIVSGDENARNVVNYIVKVIGKIKELPSVVVRRGKWIYSEGTGYGNPYGHFECDLCGDGYGYKTNFCPNCGADMRQRDDER